MYKQKYEKHKMTQNRNKSSSAIADYSTQEQHTDAEHKESPRN